MIETSFDSRVKIHQIVSNHLPEFLREESPKTTEFLKQYYISQEFQSGVVDIAENLDLYLKVDNLTPEILNDNITLEGSIGSTDETIVVSSTKGFPSEYGLLKIDDEIITYTGITTNTFTGCIRGFSGITKYSNSNQTSQITENNYNNDLVFSSSDSASHTDGSKVYNLSTLFLKEFYKKLKYTLVPGLENIDLVEGLDVNNFIKSARSFYQSKGTEEAFRILFLILYGVTPKVIDLESYLIKPSFAKFIKREIIVSELISEGNPLNLVGQTLKANYDDQLQASISEVEILTRKGKTYYKISLFIGYDGKDLIQGDFRVLGKTRVLDDVSAGASTIAVDSTIGFPNSGSLICGNNTISYTSKSINQFFGCSGIDENISIKSDVRSNEILYAYENGDTTKKVELRVTGSLSKIENSQNILLSYPGDKIKIKNVGENILNPVEDRSFKQIVANSFIYNTSTRHAILEIYGSRFKLGSKIEKSSLKVGDYVDVLVRGSVNTIVVSNAQIGEINLQTNEINLNNLQGFTPELSKQYDIRRKIKYANSLNTPLKYGNNTTISDVSNVYSENDSIYVASNSLPSYQITTKRILSTIPVSYNTNINSYFQGQITNPSSSNYKKYSVLAFNDNVEFIKGDEIVYIAEDEELPGLVSGNKYYVELLDSNKIRLYESRSFISNVTETEPVGSEFDFVCFDEIDDLNKSHTFILSKDLPENIGPKNILKKLNTFQNISGDSYQETTPGNIGILINGVEINNFKSNDKVFYGSLNNIQVINGGSNYDIVRPPYISISSGVGNTAALCKATISGNIKKVLVDPQDFDIDGVVSVVITGGNGTGATLLPITERRYRTIEFDSRFLSAGGGIDPEIDETITFLDVHNFANGEPIIYDSNGNLEIGIGTFKGSNASTKTLSNGSYYYAQVVNTKTIKLYPTLDDYNSGINTVGFSTATSTGIHKFRTKEKLVLSNIKVTNPGSNYSNHQIYVKSSGISTNFDTVFFESHHFETGDIVVYDYIEDPIPELSISNYYYVVKMDDDYFKLCDAGTDKFNLNKENFNRRKYITFSDPTNSSFHIFKYPNIEVNVKVSYGSTFSYNLPVIATPVATGSIKYLNLYEKGSGYGSNVLNFENTPILSIKTGEYAQVKPYIKDGKIIKVNVLSGGTEYYSTPNLVVNGSGSGCVLRAVILNNRLSKVIVIKEGVGYDPENTTISVVPAGSGAVFRPRLRSLTLNNYARFGQEFLINTNDEFEYTITGFSDGLSEEFNIDRFVHSPIIGWSYDGNPIYGPYGYSDPNDINSTIKRLVSGYSLNSNNVYDRPSGFVDGFFVEDYVFVNGGDLDLYNGRYCKTPEFPNGVYAYFSTINSDENPTLPKASFPYFIGPYYRSKKIEDNWSIDQDYDFENSNLSRNTFPYKVSETYADYEFFVESNEVSNQSANVDSVFSGQINSFKIIQSGEDYKIGDICYFDSDDGGSLSASVSKLNGKNIVKLDASAEKYQNSVLEWSSNKIAIYHYPYFDLFNGDYITVTGIGTYIPKLEGQQSCNVFRDQITLLSDITTNVVQNKIEDIYVSKIPSSISIGSTLNIGGSELVSVLNIFGQGSILRVMRSDVGYAHTQSDIIDVLPNTITIPINTTNFDSKINNKIYFTPNQSVGIGTTPGIGVSVEQTVGGITKTVSIPTQCINIPNHPFKTGDSAILRKLTSSRSQLVVSDTETSPSFTLLTGATKSEDIYIINKSKDLIGITTTIENAFSTNGLYIKAPIPVNSDYSIETNYKQIKVEIQKNIATITTEEEHGLVNNDQIYLKLEPKINVGIANSDTVELSYNSDYKLLLCNTLSFNTSDVDLENNKIVIQNHIFKTGDKVFYTCSGSSISGLISNNTYYVYKIDDNSFQLSETYLDTQKLYPNIITLNSVGSNFQKLSLINPELKVEKNNSLVFDVSDSSLSGYNLKLFYDSDFKKEFVSTGISSEFNFSGIGTPGLSNDAKYTLEYSSNFPVTLYYNLTKDGLNIDTDKTVINSSSIVFINNTSNGSYTVSGVGSTVFSVNLKNASQYSTYYKADTDVLEYSTRSKSAKGGINDLIVSNYGYEYKKLPIFSGTNSESGINANIVPYSNNIGGIKEYTIIDQGFDYSSDNTLRPEASVPGIIFTEGANEVLSIDVIDGGDGYSAPPSLLLKNPQTNEIVDTQSLSCDITSGSVSKININSPIKGLSSVNHEVVFINNTNGIGINSIQSSIVGVVTCVLVTPILSGFIDPPFSVGDEIFIENISKDGEIGDGFNSADYDYQFFKVKSFENTNPAVLEYSLAGLTTNPGIAKTSQLGYAIVIKKDSYPQTIVNQGFSKFIKGERLSGNFGNGFIILDLIAEETSNSYIKVSGKDITKIKIGTTLKGSISGSIAEVIDINLNYNKFKIDYSNELVLGWSNKIGELNNSNQVIEDNDYYQNLSYSIKSPIQYSDFVDSVNNLVHISGLKNFSDTQIESESTVYSSTGSSSQVIVVDVFEESRVDIINNYSQSIDIDTFENKSRYLQFKNLTLTDYIECNTNRVLSIDDFSRKFSSKNNDRDLFTNIFTYLEDTLYSKYLIQTTDVTNNQYQFDEVVVIFYDQNIYTLEKSSIKTSDVKLGDIKGEVDDYNTKTLRFTPSDPYETDYDIKYVQTYFNNLNPKVVGINTSSIGFVNLSGVSTSVKAFETSNILSLRSNTINGLVANVFVFDTVRFNMNFAEVVVDSDGTNTYLSEYYFDDNVGISTNYLGYFDSTIESGFLKLKITNNTNTELLVNANIVGFGTTSLGIGTHRFNYLNQPEGSERTARFESNYSVSAGISTVLKFKSNEITSTKSLVRVSYGNTSSIHQVMCIQDNYDITLVQYPFSNTSSNILSGIGTFGAYYSGDSTIISFYPDNITQEITIQSYNQLIYTYNDFENESLATNNALNYGNISEFVRLAAYDGINGPRANKVDFDIAHLGTPIFRKVFNPSDTAVLEKENGIINIKDHYFSTGERLIYTPKSTFVGVGQTSIGIGSTANSAGIVTNRLPTEVYAIKLDEDSIQLATRKDYALSGIYVTFTSSGEGNAHELEMYKKFEKTVISIDGIVQSPLSYTPIAHTLKDNGGQIGITTNYFGMSGISTISPGDLLKIDDEFVRVISIGFAQTTTGPVTGIGTYEIAYVDRGQVGTSATSHTDSTTVRVYKGSYNLTKNKIYFTQPPRGSARERRDFSNLPYPTSSFNGRVFLRQDYTNNFLYDDISSEFNGIDSNYTLSVQGINTTGIETGSGILFINGVFQTPSTKNNIGNNYSYTGYSGITSAVFTGITSSNGDLVTTDFDINQNQMPRGGLIVSLGSTPGLGYAPLVGASVTAVLNNATGAIVSVGLGTIDVRGSGYRSPVSVGVTDPLHTGSQAVITATVGIGGTLGFNVVSGGTGYVNPTILVSEPTYENLPVTGVFRRGIGNTTTTGENLLVSLEVGASSTTGIGSTYFEVKNFRIARPGYGFLPGDVITPVGLVTDKRLNSPLSQFELTVLDTFTDQFSSWQFGELDYIDSIKNLQNGSRKRFPLYYNGQLLSFQKGENSPDIDLNAILLIFINGVIQEPGVSYEFAGGTSFVFYEAPKPDASVSIFFYRGTRDVDSISVNVNETIKIGDRVIVRGNENIEGVGDQDPRLVEDIIGSDVIQTNIYTGQGIDSENYKFFDWEKQKIDRVINGEYVYKTRDLLESQVYPTAKIIKDAPIGSTSIFVDNIELFDYEENDFSINILEYGALISKNTNQVSAAVTAIVSTAGTIRSLDIVNSGEGYSQASPLEIKISSPKKVGVGIGTTAIASVNITNGSISGYTITNMGLGYSRFAPPQVLVPLPDAEYETVKFTRPGTVTQIARGFSGIITGILSTSGTGGNPRALKFFLRREDNATTFDDLQLGYPILIFNTNVGTGATSIDSDNNSTVGIGTEYVDNIYYVHNIVKNGPDAVIISNVKSDSNIVGLTTSGSLQNPVGNFSWGILSNLEGGLSNISIGVTGFTVSSGLSSFPTIQRKDFGLRDNGSLRKIFI
jgi:hypothetical protein